MNGGENFAGMVKVSPNCCFTIAASCVDSAVVAEAAGTADWLLWGDCAAATHADSNSNLPTRFMSRVYRFLALNGL
jgi:hypothetical protein